MPVVLPGDPYSGSGQPSPTISPPGIDPAVHPGGMPTASAFSSPGWASGIIKSLKPIQPVGTAASIYQQNITGPQAQQLEMRKRLSQSGRGVINLSDPYSSNNMAVYNAQQGVYNANEGVFGATGAQNQANRAVANNEAGNIAMRQGNFERILAASHDVGDLSNTALYNEYLNSRDRRSQLFGVAPEQRIDAPAGTVLPSGQVIAPRTNASRVQEAADTEEKRAGFLSDVLKNKATLAGIDTSDAHLTASRASAAASRVKDETGRSEDEVRYQDSLLKNDAEMQKLPPFPGAVIWEDPDTGQSEWVSAGVKEQRQYEHANQLEQERYGAKQQLSEQRSEEAKQRQVQRQTGGSPLAALSSAQLLDQYNTNRISPPGGGAQVTPVEIEAELVRRFMAQGYSESQARVAAAALIQAELDKRGEEARKKATAGAGGGSAPAPPVPQPRTR